MWANEEVLAFTRWLRAHNRERPADRRVGFHGLDVYSLWESLRAVLGYLQEHEPDEVAPALEAFDCFEPYAEDPQAYARSTRLVPSGCEIEVIALLSDLLERRGGESTDTDDAAGDAAFTAEQNARAVVGAEAYYRAMVRGGPESWNVRDTHMADTLDRLLEHYGRRRGDGTAKALVWAHNWSPASSGGAAPQRMRVPEARGGSTQAVLHDSLAEDAALFVFPRELPAWAGEERSHRAIGVVYRPEAERWGNYVSTVLGRRYDAFLWFDGTQALHPLRRVAASREELETWPTGA